eukprot:g7226.t1
MIALTSLRGVSGIAKLGNFRRLHRRRGGDCPRSSDKVAVKTDKAPTPLGPYSQGIKANKMVFVSGQLGIVPGTSNFVSESPAEQTKQAMMNVNSVLEEAGSSMDLVIKTTILMADIEDFKEINEVYGTFFGEVPPARAAFAAKALPANALVEIEAIALQGES